MTAPVAEGEVLAGKYRIERILGEGGMGVVVAATHLHLEQRVAIKFLLPAAMASAEVVSRFAREARAAAKIQSEHVARVIDVAQLEGGAPYMVMEYLEGSDLSRLLEEKGPLPIPEAVDYLLQASEALAEAHAAGIVHRDLKPANLFLARRADRTSIIKVLDFGISKAVSGTTDGVQTKTSALMGSPFYMSPEQMTNVRGVDARSDIWALGVILQELVTGKTPFYGETMPEIVAAILQGRPPPVRQLRPDAPAELEQVIDRCLRPLPADRFANVAELASMLTPLSLPHGRGAKSAERISRVLGTEGAPYSTAVSSMMQAPQSQVSSALPTGSYPGVPAYAGAGGLQATHVAEGSGAGKSVGSATNASWGQASHEDASVQAKSKAPLFIGAAAVALLVVVASIVVVVKRSGSERTGTAGGGSPSALVTAPTSEPSSAATVANAGNATPGSIEKLNEPPVALPSASAAPSTPPAGGPAAPVANTHRPTTPSGPAAHTQPPATPVAAKPPTAPIPSSKSPLQINLK